MKSWPYLPNQVLSPPDHSQAGDMEPRTTRTGRGPGRYKSICQQMHTMKGYIMLRTFLCLILLASWPEQVARGSVPGSAPGPAPPQNRAPQTVSYIDVGTLYVGGSSATVDASEYFSDPDDDKLTYSVNSPSPAIATVSIVGSMVTVKPAGVGTTGKIIITARDPGGLTATQDFNVTVQNTPPPPPPNKAPVTVGSISDVSLNKGGSPISFNVSSYFSDPNKDTLRYSVNSPSPAVAIVSISGSTVTISPVATGSTGKIIVTARDPGGLTAAQDFTATVANQPPRAVGKINSIQVPKNGIERSVSVAGKFTDPNGDTLTYSASSANTSVAKVRMSGSRLTASSGVTDTTTITVTATDTDNATGEQRFDVIVFNQHPQPRGTIAKMEFHRNEAAKSTVVSDNFYDLDRNERLTYSASSDNTSVATVSVSGGTVTVSPGSILGKARITVTATDTENASNKHGFDVEVVNGRPKVKLAIPDKTLNKNSTTSFNASSHFSDPDDDQMTFSARSSNTKIVTASVSGSTVTIESKAVVGSANVTVTATDEHNRSISATLTVRVQNSAPQVVDSFEEVNLRVDGPSERFDVSGIFSDPDNDILKFSVENPSPAIAVVSISGSEVTVAPKSEGVINQVLVKAADTEGLFISEDFRVVVEPKKTTPPPCPTTNNVRVMVPALVAGGDSVTMDVSAYFTVPKGVTPTYRTNDPNPGVATFSISGDTLTIQPKNQGYIGNVNVTASAIGCAVVNRDFDVTVDPPPTPPPPVVSSVKVNPSRATIEVGETKHFSATAYDSDEMEITGKVFTWTSSNSKVATINDAGLATALDAGSTTISAAVGSVSGTATLAVTECPAVKQMNPGTDLSAEVGGGDIDVNLNAYFTNLSTSNVSYAIKSSNPDVATASRTGTALTISPVSSGNTLVTVTISKVGCGTGASQVFNITVDPPPPPPKPTVSSVTVNPSEATIEVGETKHFSATAHDSDEMEITGKVFTWTSSNSKVATINTAGLATALDAGSTTISAAVCSVSGTATLNVEPPPPPKPTVSSVTVSPSEATIEVGETKQFSATAYDSDNTEIPGKDFTWTSSDSTVATISDAGLATALDAGSTTISAAVGSVSGTATLNVEPPPPPKPTVSSVTVSPSEATIEVGETKQFSATAYDSDNTEIPGKDFTWTSSDSTVATISDAGLATVKDAGSTKISAVVDSVSGTATLNVEPPPPPKPTVSSVTVSPSEATIEVGETKQFSATAYDSDNTEIPGKDFTWTSSKSKVATISDAGLATALDAGSTKISAVVDSVPGTATLTVTEPPPPATCPAAITDAPIHDLTLFAGVGITPIDLTEHFEHIDQVGIEITVTSPSPEIAVLSTDGNVLKIEPKSAGQIETVTVTVTDTTEIDACDPVSLSFMITVMDLASVPWSVSGEHVYRLDGNVGVGVSSPDQRLVVDGKVRAEEVYVQMTPADYVFGPDYDLMLLEDVARHIRDHGHLPGIASGAEMKNSGIGISRMQTLLLEKIEEISLYVIGQHEQLRALGHSIDSRRWRINQQYQVIRQMDRRLERLEQ